MDPLCPIILISAQGSPVPLIKFQMAPRVKLLMSSGSKGKEPRCTFFFSLKSPSKWTPSRFPNGPYGESCPLQGLFYISLIFLIKIPLNTEIFPLSQRSYKKSVPSCSPKAGPLWKQTPISRALLSISFGVPSKGALPQVSLMELPWREMPHF